jgi:hypothetical protein
LVTSIVKVTIARASLLSTNVTMKFSPYWQPHHLPIPSCERASVQGYCYNRLC